MSRGVPPRSWSRGPPGRIPNVWEQAIRRQRRPLCPSIRATASAASRPGVRSRRSERYQCDARPPARRPPQCVRPASARSDWQRWPGLPPRREGWHALSSRSAYRQASRLSGLTQPIARRRSRPCPQIRRLHVASPQPAPRSRGRAAWTILATDDADTGEGWGDRGGGGQGLVLPCSRSVNLRIISTCRTISR
jgi:hypothetical protein